MTPEVCLRLCLLTDSSTCCSHFVQKSNGAEYQKNPRERMPFRAEVKSLLNRNQTLQLSSCSCRSLGPDRSHHQKTESRTLAYWLKLNDRFRILSNWFLEEASILRAIASRHEGIESPLWITVPCTSYISRLLTSSCSNEVAEQNEVTYEVNLTQDAALLTSGFTSMLSDLTESGFT